MGALRSVMEEDFLCDSEMDACEIPAAGRWISGVSLFGTYLLVVATRGYVTCLPLSLLSLTFCLFPLLSLSVRISFRKCNIEANVAVFFTLLSPDKYGLSKSV